MRQITHETIEAARRRVALVDDMLTEAKRSGPYLGRTRDLANLERELAEQKRQLRALETSAPALI